MRFHEKRYTPALLITAALALFVTGCAASLEISPENQERIREYWSQYNKSDPAWPEARAEWLAMGDDEAQGLINLLIQEVQRNSIKTVYRPSGLPEPGWKRPVNELVIIGKRAIPSVLRALKLLKDETVVLPCQTVLKEIAQYMDIVEAFERAFAEGNIRYQTRLVKVLIMLEEPESFRQVSKIIEGPYVWKVRATAVSELSRYEEGPLLSEAKKALAGALVDDDEFIASTARKALKAMNDPGDKP